MIIDWYYRVWWVVLRVEEDTLVVLLSSPLWMRMWLHNSKLDKQSHPQLGHWNAVVAITDEAARWRRSRAAVRRWRPSSSKFNKVLCLRKNTVFTLWMWMLCDITQGGRMFLPLTLLPNVNSSKVAKMIYLIVEEVSFCFGNLIYIYVS